MADEPKPEFNFYFTPDQLKTNKTFQASWVVCKPFMQNMLQHLQREKAEEHKEDKEEAGRQILIINDLFKLLDRMTSTEPLGKSSSRTHKPLNNK